MSLAKYRDLIKESNGQPVYFGRAHLDGAPFRGQVSPLRDEEFNSQKELEYETHARVFRLWVDEDMKAYQQVLDKVANRVCRLWYRQHLPVPDQQSFVVLVEWSDRFITLNPLRNNRPLPPRS